MVDRVVAFRTAASWGEKVEGENEEQSYTIKLIHATGVIRGQTKGDNQVAKYFWRTPIR